MNIKRKIKDKIEKFKLKQDILVAKGILSDIYREVDWNKEDMTTEQQLKVKELMTQILIAENALNCK